VRAVAAYQGLGIVTARGGSKGLPRKNLRKVGGLSLVARAVRSGVESGCCEEVVCTTDDERIAAEATAAGARVLMRPSELAADTALSVDVVRHVLDCEGRSWPWFVLLQPTSPLRTPAHVRGAIEQLLRDEVEAVVSAVRAPAHPFKCLIDDGTGELVPVRSTEDLSAPRQAMPRAWHPNGAVYVCRTVPFRRSGTFFCGRFSIFPMDEESSIDIDVASDLRRARSALRRVEST
jgi:N-acylneuraminate cytidylyltransferase